MFVTSFDNIKIFYTKYYSEKPKGTILFVHGGFHGNHTLLNGLIEKFKQEYNIIAPDLRGRGNSDFPKDIEKHKLEDYAKDLYEILKLEKIRKVNLVGISFGGLVSLKFASMFPEKIEKVVLISSAHRLDSLNHKVRILLPLYLFLLDILSCLFSFLPEKRGKNIIYPPLGGVFEQLNYGWAIISNNSFKTILLRHQIMKKCKEFGISIKELKQIKKKILLIYGKKDFYFPYKIQKELMEGTKCKIIALDNVGHDFYFKNGSLIINPMKKFFCKKNNSL